MTQTICIALTSQTWACPPDKTLAVMESAIEAQYRNIVRAVTVMIERIEQRTATPATIIAETFDSLENKHLQGWHDCSVRLDLEEFFRPNDKTQEKEILEDVLDTLKPLFWSIDLARLKPRKIWGEVSERLHQTIALSNDSGQIHQFDHFTVLVCQDPDATHTQYNELWQRALRIAALPAVIRQIVGISLGVQPRGTIFLPVQTADFEYLH